MPMIQERASSSLCVRLVAQAGIMSEMVDDTLGSLDEDNEELEEEAEAEVEGVLFEITDGKLGQAGKVGGKLPVRRRPSHPFRSSIS